MAERKPLVIGASGLATEIDAGDTFPASSLPARVTISPPQITADQDNYAPTGWDTADVVRLDFDTNGRAITGFVAWTNGRAKTLLNISGNYGYIPCEHPDSTAANRVVGSCDHIIAPYSAVVIECDATTSRIRIISNPFNHALLGIGNLRGIYYQQAGASTTAADWGDFAFNASGGSLGTTIATSTTTGGWSLSTGTGTTGAISVYFSKGLVSPAFSGTSHLIASFYLRIPTLSDGAQTFSVSVGIVPTPSSVVLDVNNSCHFKYSHGLNSGKWLAVNRNNAGTETTVDTGVTVATGTANLLTVCIDKALSESRYYIDGLLVATITGSMPSGAAVGPRAAIIKSAGTTARTIILSNFMFSAVY